jgi:hypothetical protein
MVSLAAMIKKDANSEQSFIGIRELKEGERNSLDNARKNIALLKILIDTSYAMNKNFDEFLAYSQYIKENQELIIQMKLNFHPTMENIVQETNRLLLNVLFSMTANVEHFKYNLQATDRNKYAEMLNNLFDTCLDYAFIYKLRNYSQHQQLPITNITASESIEEPSKIKVFIDKDILLKYDSWGKIVKPYLEQKEQEFEITNMLINAISNLHNKVFLYWMNKYIDNTENDFGIIVAFIEEIIKHCQEKGVLASYPCILEDIKQMQETSQGLKMQISYFPIEFLQKLGIINVNYII